MRKAMFQSYGRCHYCRTALTKPTATNHGPRMATRDHVVPASRGGTKTVACCRHCNTLKADMMPDEWNAFRMRNPTWYFEGFRLPNSFAAKAADRAEIFRQLRIKAISPTWPMDIRVPPRSLCRGLAA